MEDYETIDYKKHYETTRTNKERIEELEKQVRILNNLVTSKGEY